MSLSNELFSAFHYRPYGTFFLHSKSPTLSKVVLPTTDIIEPKCLKVWDLVFQTFFNASTPLENRLDFLREVKRKIEKID